MKKTRRKDNEGLSPLGAEMAAGLSAFCDVLEAGEPIERRYTVRTVVVDLAPTQYGPGDVKALRSRLGGSQPLFARFLGVSVKTLRAWEQGVRPVPPIACRFLDEIAAHPELWSRRIRTIAAGT
jgi:putative transcriptional regulator